jgi:hypothetical protein
MRHRLLVALAALATSGCNAYDYFRMTGAVQESFSGQADILFVIDNSPTMTDEAEALAVNFSSFIEAFADNTEAPVNPTLSENVERYVDFVIDPAGNLNYQLGITTTNAPEDFGELLGTPNFLKKSDDNIARKFTSNLICDAACIEDVPEGVSVSCDGSPGNCVDSLEGSREEGIESVFMAMCRAVEDPPAACFQRWWEDDDIAGGVLPEPPRNDTGGPALEAREVDYFNEDHVGTNRGFIRSNSTVIPIIVTDEGDKSRRIPNGETRTDRYDELFALFPNRMAWAVIGPLQNGCNTAGASPWQIDRYRRLVEASNGVYIPINEPAENNPNACPNTDFGEALTRVGELLRALTDTFPLRALPVPETIVVTVDGEPVPESTPTFNEELGLTVYEDGWSYSVTNNSVVLHGDALPDFDEEVRVWYLPVGGIPRDLPF